MDPMISGIVIGVLVGVTTSLLVSGVAAVVTIKAINTELRFHKEALSELGATLKTLPCTQPRPC